MPEVWVPDYTAMNVAFIGHTRNGLLALREKPQIWMPLQAAHKPVLA